MPDSPAPIAPPPAPLLGELALPRQQFAGLGTVMQEFGDKSFARLNARQRYERICRNLLMLVQDAPHEAFLLPAFADFLDQVSHANLLASSINQSGFEMWLNLMSGLSEADNAKVRGKITGKYLPREAYQPLFPIGMGNLYPGSHFVTAHNPPDLDTTTASFWGWVDAFSARVGEHLQIWNLPGGTPSRQVTMLFEEILGTAIFKRIAKNQTHLTMVGRDLVTQKNLIRKRGHESMDSVDHERHENAVILVDEQGYYLGDWRSTDVEGVRQVQAQLDGCLRWYENQVHLSLINLFTREDLKRQELAQYVDGILHRKLGDSEPVKQYTPAQRKQLAAYLTQVLGVEQELNASFAEFGARLDRLGSSSFARFRATVEGLTADEWYDPSGYLREDRPRIFHLLARIYSQLYDALRMAHAYQQRLDVAMSIKRLVLGFGPNYVTTQTDVDEIRTRMAAYNYLTVAYLDARRNLIPVGIIRSLDLRRGTLGTVSLRDFGNFEEISLPPYLQVISVVDHHKTNFSTSSPPLAVIGDAQATSVLLAELAFQINDGWSTNGMSKDAIAAQLAELTGIEDKGAPEIRLIQRLYKRQMAAARRGQYFVHPVREFTEYLSFLNAILDDTDLLTKVTRRDLVCTAEIVNRLKSLQLGREVEVVQFDDLEGHPQFVKEAAKRLLRNADLRSFYRKIFRFRESELENKIRLCVSTGDASLFEDSKRQNGVCQVGQIKIFAPTYTALAAASDELRAFWARRARAMTQRETGLDLHIQMISTIAGADEAYTGALDDYPHLDELWFWIPETPTALDHLQSFLFGFSHASGVAAIMQEAVLIGKLPRDLSQILGQAFPKLPITKQASPGDDLAMVVLRFTAGRLNSRKACISPYLPKVGG